MINLVKRLFFKKKESMVNRDDSIDYIEQALFIGRMAQEAGRYDDAIDNYNLVLQHRKDMPYDYFFRGTVKEDMGDYQGACEDYASAINLKNDDWRFYFNRAVMYIHLEEYYLAKVDLDKACELEPDAYEPLMRRGALLYHLYKNIYCIEDFDSALRIKPDEPSLYLMKARALVETCRFSEGREVLLEGLANCDNNEDILECLRALE